MLRVMIGFVLMFGALGGITESITDTELVQAVGIAVLGLVLFYFGMQDQSRT